MSPGPNPSVDPNLIDQVRKQVARLAEEVAHLAEQDLSPAHFYGEFLKRVLAAIAAPAGAVWVRTPQGNLQMQYQINLQQVGLDRSDEGRQSHDELLRQATQMGRWMILPPRSGAGTPEGSSGPAAGNPTDYVILIAPILVDKQVAGLLEVWQDPDRHVNAQRGFMQFLMEMAGLASAYTRNHQLRQLVNQQQLWNQLEAFARQIHGSLEPMMAAYQVANEGRRLVDCDRISVGMRWGKRTSVEAISGADVVEKRSNLVQLMRKLMDSVLVWGERLVYTGTKDDSLPPTVLKALDAYLAESNSKLLVVLPLRDEREEESKRPPRSVLMMECFAPNEMPEQMIARLEVVGRHATTALYNAAEHRRIPMRFIWKPLARVQEGLGGKARAIITLVGLAFIALAATMVVVPYPLKMDASGQLLPKERSWIYPLVEGRVVEFKVSKGQDVKKDEKVVLMRDISLAKQLTTLRSEILGSMNLVRFLTTQLNQMQSLDEKLRYLIQLNRERAVLDGKEKELRELTERINADDNFRFWLTSPRTGTVLNADFEETVTNRLVKPSDPLLRVGNLQGPWEIELKIPQRHIGQVKQAFLGKEPNYELDVDILLKSVPTSIFKGKLKKEDIAGEATPNRDDNNEAEPVVLAIVRIEGTDIAANSRIPRDQYHTGTEVRAKIRCGTAAMGYSLFYGIWEFFYEKVVFFF